SASSLSRPAASGLDFLSGGGEMGERIRAKDWAKTSLGPPAQWPQSLQIAIRIMLASRQPVWIGWGPQFIYFYNDSYKSIVGGRHPVALGLPADQVWPETWSQIGPMLRSAMGGDLGYLRGSASSDHGAQWLSRGNLLHLVVHTDSECRRQ